jgi:hypothetical protein
VLAQSVESGWSLLLQGAYFSVCWNYRPWTLSDSFDIVQLAMSGCFISRGEKFSDDDFSWVGLHDWIAFFMGLIKHGVYSMFEIN